MTPSIRDPEIQGVLKRPFAEQVAFFRSKLGNLVPTQAWDDLSKSEHDRAFMVAGAAKADLLADLAAAVDRGITEGVGIGEFRKDFAEIVKKHGWDFNGEFNWRTRVILRTNAATSYAAGRLAQLREAGFSHWMYKHGGSADPRPQHLAWDGLVLPADHPFWSTHSPPNGWGCSCRIVGLRRPEDAKRLGGDPDKTLPEGWDTVVAKTGEPAGIDRGWGYQPGATVVDDVRQMAAKTQQWEYSLAKSYMQGVPESVRDALATAYRELPSVADDVRRYAKSVLAKKVDVEVPPYRTMGLVTSEVSARVADLIGSDVRGFDYAIDKFAPLHIHAEHGDAKVEARRGQRAITESDYGQLPAILNDPDEIRADGDELVVEKQFDSERWVTIFAVLGRRRTLVLKSMRIYKKAPSRSTS